MTKQKQIRYKERRALQQSGFELDGVRTIRLHRNPVDETVEHVQAKAIAAKVCATEGYAVDSEVAIGQHVADIVAYGHETRKPVVVELSHRNDEESTESNLQAFHKGPVREVYTISVESLPTEPHEQAEAIRQELGL